MPEGKWLVVVGLAPSFVGVAILMWDVWLWRGAFALILLGTLLQFVGTILSP